MNIYDLYTLYDEYFRESFTVKTLLGLNPWKFSPANLFMFMVYVCTMQLVFRAT